MKKRELLDRAIERCDALRLQYPGVPPLESLRAQLAYLKELETGKSSDRSRLKDLSIGVIVAREIEDRDPDFAALLYKLMEELRI